MDIKEYDPAIIATRGRLNAALIQIHRPLKISYLRLAIAHAKILCTKKTTIPRYFWGAIEVMVRRFPIRFVNNNLRYTREMNDLRDSYITYTIGALAEAINFLWIQEYLKYPIVYDFKAYLYDRHNIVINANIQSPDFIVTNAQGGYTLIESKGTISLEDKTKQYLKKGLQQCTQGELQLRSFFPHIYPAAYKKFAAVAQLCAEESILDSTIHFCDPSADDEDLKYDSSKLIKHYFFSLLEGFTKISLKKYRNNQTLLEEHFNTHTYLGNIFYDIGEIAFDVWFSPERSAKYRLGVLKHVLDLLVLEEIYTKKILDILENYINIYADIFQKNSDINIINNEPSYVELFADGTIIWLAY